MRRRTAALLLTLLAAGCLLPSPEQVREFNAQDEGRVRTYAAKQLDCPIAEVRAEGMPNTLNRIATWTVTACGTTGRYRISEGQVHPVAPSGTEH